MQQNVKKADFSGMFYPAGDHELNSLLEYLLSENKKSFKSEVLPKGIIVPHAGYVYSGVCAASVYNIVQSYAQYYKRIYLFGPAHKEYFSGLRSLNKEAFAIPLGNLKLDKEEISNLVAEGLVSFDDAAFNGEHSIEVQLPFIYKIFSNNVKIVPILVGDSSSEEILSILNKLKKDSLFVISSDLSHYLSLEQEQKTDKLTIDNIEKLNCNSVDNEDACGSIALNASINYAKSHNLQVQNIDFSNSSEISNDNQKVVGYASFIIF